MINFHHGNFIFFMPELLPCCRSTVEFSWRRWNPNRHVLFPQSNEAKFSLNSDQFISSSWRPSSLPINQHTLVLPQWSLLHHTPSPMMPSIHPKEDIFTISHFKNCQPHSLIWAKFSIPKRFVVGYWHSKRTYPSKEPHSHGPMQMRPKREPALGKRFQMCFKIAALILIPFSNHL